jgi:hypothetical protein
LNGLTWQVSDQQSADLPGGSVGAAARARIDDDLNGLALEIDFRGRNLGHTHSAETGGDHSRPCDDHGKARK